MPNKRRQSDKTWSLYPQLHNDVSRLLQEDGLEFQFHRTDSAQNCIDQYDSNIMGRFVCHNPGCNSKGWSSKKIPLTIRMYQGRKYNARVYHQRCKSCNAVSRPYLDDSYSERVAYRLKKWSGIEMDRPFYSWQQTERPHESHLCEGCRAGHCSEGLGVF